MKVENRRPDAAAVGTVCILDRVEKGDRTIIPIVDRSYLKWAGQAGYERTILPDDFGVVDLFTIRADAPGVFLHSLRDTPREPILVEDGEYILFFKLFSSTFPLVEFAVKLNLRWKPPTADSWSFESKATLTASVSGPQFIGKPDRDALATILGKPKVITPMLVSGNVTSGSFFGPFQDSKKNDPKSMQDKPETNPPESANKPVDNLVFDEEVANRLSGKPTK